MKFGMTYIHTNIHIHTHIVNVNHSVIPGSDSRAAEEL